MASTRDIVSPGVFAENASTTIPSPPLQGIPYRDPVAGPASVPNGWPYFTKVNSAEFNQLMYQYSTLLTLMDRRGVLGWTDVLDYTESALVLGSDGALYFWLQESGPGTVAGVQDPTAAPTYWAPLSSGSSGLRAANAGGSSNALTATFDPPVTALDNGVAVLVRAASANTGTAPTFAPDGMTAKTIVKGSDGALVAGDIPGAGAWLMLVFNNTLDRWVLLNPAFPLEFSDATENQAGVSSSKVVSPLGLQQAFSGSNQNKSVSGFQRLPGGVILQWGSVPLGSPSSVTFPIAFPSAAAIVVGQPVTNNTGVSGVCNLVPSSTTSVGFSINAGTPALWFALGY